MSQQVPSFNHVILLCRSGFEGECSAEIIDRAATIGVTGYCKTDKRSGVVVFTASKPATVMKLIETLSFATMIFARQWFAAIDEVKDLPVKDRVSSLAQAAGRFPRCKELWLETPDTNEGNSLSKLCKGLQKPLQLKLKSFGALRASGRYRLHMLFTAGDRAWVGMSLPGNDAPWLGGIPRLRFPKAAPSRSTLKLEEAWHWFLPADGWGEELKAGSWAVDLGAAPGGWTWQLVQRGLKVMAVDNGPMNNELMLTRQVEHHEADGFLFEPPRAVAWMVCDIADKPARVIHLMSTWLVNRWCRKSVFNLKLPMAKRYLEVCKLLDRLQENCDANGVKITWCAKQLYHDREEITVMVRLVD
ncbi:23S rRNA (cytidine2498-2'-O)-methyltransferase [Sinobacterium caligoides]|uniref:Ribosomal RNA large subunit methyltransferase M n=1 Tax=Sinobacterium caligoides TaxID=933926 RepID=A0A3N2DNX8_9GAMM|nr:23S rRNA (cytidine(2498)-2'-O)-methyltransferase RlmM [Sinobacterium caligoides]ROS01402.1 23S rRNA (cytidine2498-2'-O)-methyltransferase [Sinobacterium caligoides]